MDDNEKQQPDKELTPTNQEQDPAALLERVAELENQLEQKQREIDELEKLAFESPVTGLPNRHFFDQALPRRIEEAQTDEDNKHFSLLLIDLNKFKPVNDQRSYAVGDKVLRIFGEKLKDHLRTHESGDHPDRELDIAIHLTTHWGGDEFAVILEQVADADQAGEVIHRLSRAVTVDETDIADLHGLQPVTASFGFACYEPGMDREEMFNIANHSLHGSKQGNGSNESR